MHSSPFPPFTNPISRFRPEGMFSSQFILLFSFFFLSFNRLTILYIDAAVIRPRLDKFHLDRIERVRAFPGRTFHDLVTLSHLAAWGLGPLPTAENLNHEETTRRSEYPQFIFPFFIFVLFLLFFFFFLT